MTLSIIALVLLLPTEPRLPVESAFPATSAVLPTNARVVVFGSEGNVYSLERGDGSVEVVDVDTRFSNGADVLELPPLVADESIVVDVLGVRFEWVVGDNDDTAIPVFVADTSITVEEVNRGKTGTTGPDAWFIELCLPALVDEEPVLARIGGDALADTVLVAVDIDIGGGCNDGHAARVVVDGERSGEACLDVVAVDVAGNAGVAETVCAALFDPTPGCAQTSTSTSLLFALSALVLRRRRR